LLIPPLFSFHHADQQGSKRERDTHKGSR